MQQRFVAIWFPCLMTDWMIRRKPELKDIPFVMAAAEHGRMIVRAASPSALYKGIKTGMVIADCRAILPSLEVLEEQPELVAKALLALGEWCIRYTPAVAVDGTEGLILDASGCAHLWGGETAYLNDIVSKLSATGYCARTAMADTIGAAWALSRFGSGRCVIPPGQQMEALLPLPPASLRLEPQATDKLLKLGLYTVNSFIRMPGPALRRRFGQAMLTRLHQALGQAIEAIEPVCPVLPYEVRLPSLEPICTLTGIEIALRQLLDQLCARMVKEGKGVRSCRLRCFRVDGNIQEVAIGTNRPSRNAAHLAKLFETKLGLIEPDLGIELFLLQAPITEDLDSRQEAFWNQSGAGDCTAVAELLDTIAGKLGNGVIHRYLPEEHYWPERSYREAVSPDERPATAWRTDLPRPLHLLPKPEPIEVTVPRPDYPPMSFRYKGQVYKVGKADGPERIEQEWWLQQGVYRDYYCVEVEQGARYWVFRSGDYRHDTPEWFMHGFFA